MQTNPAPPENQDAIRAAKANDWPVWRVHMRDAVRRYVGAVDEPAALLNIDAIALKNTGRAQELGAQRFGMTEAMELAWTGDVEVLLNEYEGKPGNEPF